MAENEKESELDNPNNTPKTPDTPETASEEGPTFSTISLEEKLTNLQEIVSSCQGVIAELRDEKHDLVAQIQRSSADFANFQKRARKDRDQAKLETTRSFLEKLIPILDNLGFALTALKDADPAIKDPILMIQDAFVKVLSEKNVTQVVPQIGDPFNSEWHQAISVLAGDTPGEFVAHIARNGYAIGEHVFRPADVVVKKA